MNRRDVIKSLGMVSLHALYPSVLTTFLASCKSGEQNDHLLVFFNAEEFDVIKETIDIILPATRTKSASQTGTHYFVDNVFAACLNDDQKKLIKDGLSIFIFQWKKTDDKTSFVKKIDQQAFTGVEDAAWFKVLKQYTLIGFFTSEEGTTNAGDYQKIPDKFTGDVAVGDATLAHSVTALRFSL